MRAIQFNSPGSPEVLKVGSIPQPQVQTSRELLIELKAAGVNPIDTKLRQRGTFYPEQMPAVLGCDGAGVVVDVGSQVQNFRVGDAVYFCQGGLGDRPGTYAEYAVVDERCVAPKPECLSFAEAAAAPLVLITAWEALCDRGQLQPGQRVLIHAGAGGVGHVAIQLAKLKGAQVATTISSPEKARFVEGLGAEFVIFYRQTDVVSAIMTWTEDSGVDLAFDTVGGSVLSQCFAATQIYGNVVTLLAPASDTDWGTARQRNLRVSYELMLTPLLQGLIDAQHHQAQILQECAQWFDQGQLHIELSKTFPLDAAVDAHRLLESGSMQGKIALLI
jgi:NADPH2:quinone reductase